MPKRKLLFLTSPLVVLLWLTSLLMNGAAQAAPSAQTVTLFAQADAMVHAGTAATNYGAGNLGVTPDNQSYVWFDVSAIPAGATINSAILMLMPADIVGTGPHTIGVARVQETWNEATVTWNTKPAVGTPAVFASVGAYTMQSWDVTPAIQQIQAGAMQNYGVALLTNTPGVYFHSKETGPAPRLIITASLDPDDDPDQPVPQDKPFVDLGDAPDSSNNHGQNNTAYPGTLGRFPTVYQGTAAGQPAGPLHVNARVEAILGDNISREQGADGGADADGVNNILRTPADAVADTADNDRADDGWRNRNVPILDCQRVSLVVRVRKAPGAQLDQMYLNVFHDGNQDGDWADVGVCQFEGGQQARSYEWIVQDYALNLAALPAGSHNITVTTVLAHSPKPNAEAQGSSWMRFSLSEQKAPRNPATSLADGRGLHPDATPRSYAFGETEDILYRPDPKGQPGTLTLQKGVTVQSTPVGYADTVTYTIRLKNTGGTEPVQAEIRDLLPYPQHLLPYIEQGNLWYVSVKELSAGVSPLTAQVKNRLFAAGSVQQAVIWEGTLAPDAEVELSFNVHVHPLCQPDQDTATITNTVTLHRPDGTKVDEKSVNFEAACPGYSVSDIQVSQTLIADGANAIARDTSQTRPSDNTNVWGDPHVDVNGVRATFTNIATQPVRLGFSLNFEEIKVTAGQTVTSTQPVCHLIRLDPGEQRSLDVWANLQPLLQASGAIPNDPSEEIGIRSRLRYTLLPPDENLDCPMITRLASEQLAENILDFYLRPWDAGDAPDSTNHPSTPMTAYPGVPANFPTVFDVTTGAPEGPRHARPRPFHLGPRVEFEPDADLGPAPRNIDPTTNTVNRDRYDDGVNLGSIAFQHCQTTTFQARVYISAAAQAALLQKGFTTGYINSWVDSNRDGDWADAAQCANGSAPEHIVIDQPVDIASLTPGLNTITVATTGPAAWPGEMAEKAAWLRVMLSEEKSVKLAGLPYGDGRGPASGYRTGETEDYLLRPQGQGADPAIDAALLWEPQPASPAGKRAAKVTLRVHYYNDGSEPALDSRIAITLPAMLNESNLLQAISAPELALDKSSPLLLNLLGTLEPGASGHVAYSWKVEEGEAGVRDGAAFNFEEIKVTLRILSISPDANLANNIAAVETAIPAIVPSLGFGVPDSPNRAANATTSRDNVDLRGTAQPGEMLTIYVEHIRGDGGDTVSRSSLTHWPGPLTATVQTGDNGAWSYNLGDIVGGVYRVRAGYIVPGMNRAATLDKSSPKLQEALLRVDPNLPIDPLSFVITDDQGRSWTPDTLNFNREMASAAFVPGRTYSMTVQQTPNIPHVGMSLNFHSPLQTFLFADLGSGTLGWTGCLTCTRSIDMGTATTGNYSLIMDVNGQETILDGLYYTTQPGRVSDAATGQTISGASVRLLIQTTVSDTLDSGPVYAPWDGAGGQPNPQTTGGDGSYIFVPPAGVYRVQVTAAGYQPYTSPAITIADGEAVAVAVALSPAVEDAPDVIISIGSGGFDPGALAVPPGTTIRWVNVDVTDHSVVGIPSSRAASGFDSGLLSPGASYTHIVSEAGTLSLSDGTNPFNQAALVVDPSAPNPGMRSLFLPAVQR